MTTTEFKFALASTRNVFDQTLVIVVPTALGWLTVLESSVHKHWAVHLGASFGSSGAPRYNPSKCFNTFPFPPEPTEEIAVRLNAIGSDIYDVRMGVMLRSGVGLTKTHNRLHDPDERDPDILHLRAPHTAMDRAVLDAYGWTDIPTDGDFFLDYEIDEETWGDKKKPYRYCWPDAVRDEVLARLLDLNQKRHQEAVAAGLHGKHDRAFGTPAQATAKAPRKPRAAAKPAPPTGTLPLFGRNQDEDA